MKREIKFRAWNGKEMMQNPQLLVSFDDGSILDNSINDYCPDWILMQSTGLKDRKGKEIYEGDIVRLYEWKNNPDIYKIHPNLFQVDWSEDRACFELYSPDELWGKTPDGKDRETDQDIDIFYPFRADEDKYEVIGNIYENPELLK